MSPTDMLKIGVNSVGFKGARRKAFFQIFCGLIFVAMHQAERLHADEEMSPDSHTIQSPSNPPEPDTLKLRVSSSHSTNEAAEPLATVVQQPNPALQWNARLFESSNLLTSARSNPALTHEQELQQLFDLAREQHRQKSYTQASQNFVSILKGDAPDEMKRMALLELAFIAQEQDQWARAQQIFSQYLALYPTDPSVPEIMLRQGLLYRKMGATTLALSKFYGVMTKALTLKEGSFNYYQRLVLEAQTEIAETYYLQGKHQEAADFFERLLKLDAPELSRARIQFKLLRCLADGTKTSEVVAQARDFITRYPDDEDVPEARFILARTLKQLGRNREALQEVLALLKSQQSGDSKNSTDRTYWQQRAGNEIANQLYQENDYVNALDLYLMLVSLNPAAEWQLPVLYQIGLVYEHLHQTRKAAETYAGIVERQKELAPDASPGLKTVVDMANWRHDFVMWQTQTERTIRTNAQATAEAPLPPAP